MSQQTIAVFGATGKTGRHVVAAALQQGYKVRALARTPSKVEPSGPDLEVIKGTFEDVTALAETVKGATYVVCCAGGASGKAYQKGMMIDFVRRLWPLLDAEASVEVFLFQSVIFAPKADGTLPLLLKLLAPVAAAAKGNTKMLEDNTAVTKFMAADKRESFDFIVTRPGALVEKESRATLRADQDKASLSPMTFADLGVFTVDALVDPTLYGTYPFVVVDE